MIYVTGDTHGDIARFKSREMKKLRRRDTLIVTGDFGFIWDGSRREKRQLRWLSHRRYNLLFVDGTHDNFDLLSQYPEVEYCGGKARKIGKRLYYLCRGEVFTIENKTVFAMGGGESLDLDVRIPGVSWWPQEQPSMPELRNARNNLAKYDDRIDFIVTHDCSTTLMDFIDMDNNRITPLNAFFEVVGKNCRFTRWAFGCYHQDKRIPASYIAVFKSVMPLE